MHRPSKWTDSNVCFSRLTAAITRFGSAVPTTARKDRPISVEIPRIETVADSIKAAAAIATAVAEGEHPDGGGRA
jgi:hypothetical protein